MHDMKVSPSELEYAYIFVINLLIITFIKTPNSTNSMVVDFKYFPSFLHHVRYSFRKRTPGHS